MEMLSKVYELFNDEKQSDKKRSEWNSQIQQYRENFQRNVVFLFASEHMGRHITEIHKKRFFTKKELLRVDYLKPILLNLENSFFPIPCIQSVYIQMYDQTDQEAKEMQQQQTRKNTFSFIRLQLKLVSGGKVEELRCIEYYIPLEFKSVPNKFCRTLFREQLKAKAIVSNLQNWNSVENQCELTTNEKQIIYFLPQSAFAQQMLLGVGDWKWEEWIDLPYSGSPDEPYTIYSGAVKLNLSVLNISASYLMRSSFQPFVIQDTLQRTENGDVLMKPYSEKALSALLVFLQQQRQQQKGKEEEEGKVSMRLLWNPGAYDDENLYSALYRLNAVDRKQYHGTLEFFHYKESSDIKKMLAEFTCDARCIVIIYEMLSWTTDNEQEGVIELYRPVNIQKQCCVEMEVIGPCPRQLSRDKIEFAKTHGYRIFHLLRTDVEIVRENEMVTRQPYYQALDFRKGVPIVSKLVPSQSGNLYWSGLEMFEWETDFRRQQLRASFADTITASSSTEFTLPDILPVVEKELGVMFDLDYAKKHGKDALTEDPIWWKGLSISIPKQKQQELFKYTKDQGEIQKLLEEFEHLRLENEFLKEQLQQTR